MEENKKDIMWRIYLIYFGMCLFGVAIIFQIFKVQVIEGNQWRDKAEALTTKYINIEAVRGNIFAADGSLLATSYPKYEVRMDMMVAKESMFYDGIDSLSYCLSKLFGDKSWHSYKSELVEARRDGERYHLIKGNVDYIQLKKMKSFPIFREGRYKGGIVYTQQNKRARPFKGLAARTIGYQKDNISVGLEGAYDEHLAGVGGKRLMQRISGGVWKPLNDENEIEPKDGSDLVTTIDINIQDVAESALRTQLMNHAADHGCAVLMEVATGEVKAIVNLTRGDDGNYYESFNYAIGELTEPGSTFKLASVIALLEEGGVSIGDSVDTEDGITYFHNVPMKDSDYDKGGHGKITLQQTFELSSNVGIAKMVTKHFEKDPQKYVDVLYKMGLNDSLGIEIAGEGKPQIINTQNKQWSGITLPWMSIGYEVLMTPMQILAFYNAVANDGKLVRPKFVKEIRNRGKVKEVIETEVLNNSICSKSTIDKVRVLLEGVVQRGTATNVKHADYQIAGKTGTAQINYGDRSQRMKYQASFAGYFPADNPKYSGIIVINNPSKYVYYASYVAAPVFKEIADKVYSTQIDIHKELTNDTAMVASIDTKMPWTKVGHQKDLVTALNKLKINTHTQNASSRWVDTNAMQDTVDLTEKNINEQLIPKVVGMGAADAVYLLENLGLKVKLDGSGVIVQQSILPGTRVTKNREIVLRLS